LHLAAQISYFDDGQQPGLTVESPAAATLSEHAWQCFLSNSRTFSNLRVLAGSVCDVASWASLLHSLLRPEYDFGGHVAHGNSNNITDSSSLRNGDSKSAPAVSAGMGEGLETKSSAPLVPAGADAKALWTTVPVVLTVSVLALALLRTRGFRLPLLHC
jgi:hypothetical protein